MRKVDTDQLDVSMDQYSRNITTVNYFDAKTSTSTTIGNFKHSTSMIDQSIIDTSQQQQLVMNQSDNTLIGQEDIAADIDYPSRIELET